MRDVAIIGAGMIPFGRRDEDSLMDMLAHASLNALDDAGLGDESVDAVYVASMGAGILLKAGPEAPLACNAEKTEDQDLGYDENQHKGKEYFKVQLSRFHGASTNM